MCLIIDTSVKTLNKRVVWKVCERQGGRIVSLIMAATYPKGKLIERSAGEPVDKYGTGRHGLHFYLSKGSALHEAKIWPNSYIAKFAVSPKDFMFADTDGETAMYQRATRVGNYIKVGLTIR